MRSIREWLAGASHAGDADSRSDAELLLAHALGRSRTWLFMHPEFVPDADAAAGIERLFAARARGEPVAYLLGQRGFHALELEVTPDVLIPRAETELLVDSALARMATTVALDVADLGTGSGAVALSIAHARRDARVLATDASAVALAVARANAERLLILNVEFVLGHWCQPLAGRTFDLIVSNPPYIAADDVHLSQGDLRFEPAAALASGVDGLDAIREIVACAPSHLRSGGWLLLEHGWDQGAAVRHLLQQKGFGCVATLRDLGDRDRVSLGQWVLA